MSVGQDKNQPYLGIYYLSTWTPEAKEDSSEEKHTIINVFSDGICSCLVQKKNLQNLKSNSEEDAVSSVGTHGECAT